MHAHSSSAFLAQAAAAGGGVGYMLMRTRESPLGALFFEFSALASRLWRHYKCDFF
jgi:hypothetical protein